MNQKGLHILFILFLCQAAAFAQMTAIQTLPEVVLTDSKLNHFSEGFKVEKLSDTVIKRNAGSLTETLRYNSTIYFKENGYGMVSSPSFRGTNAAQTAVIWNGININSNFTGQTDFNVISPINYDQISIRSGGGGVQYGSGAVGGSIHLNNVFTFKERYDSELAISYGSFSTLATNLSTTKSNKDYYLNVAVDFMDSENDYEYIGKNKKNNHGEFKRFSTSINTAKKLKLGLLSLNSEYSYNDRNFSGSLNTYGKDAYKDINTRNLVQLVQKLGSFETTARVAHLFEQYRYYPDSEKPPFSQGRANTLLAAVESEVAFDKKLRFNAKLESTFIDAKGDNVGEHARNSLAAVILINHEISENFNYSLNFRKEFSDEFDNPFLFSADAKWQLTGYYAIRLNGSKNYRVPTFNDLYWYAGGNFNLKPETSYQIELGQEFHFGSLSLDIATYFISSKNLIKWSPGDGSLWKPSNLAKTQNLGLEAKLGYDIQIFQYHNLGLQAIYSYTDAQDLDKGLQLIYVPFHKISGFVDYKIKDWTAYFQGMFTGSAFTTTDNSESVKSSAVFNMGATYNFSTHPDIAIGAQIENIFDTYYETVAYRPMPSRNFQISLNFKI